MLLQRLADYARERLDLPPPMYQEQPIRYVIELDRGGRMLGAPIDTADPNNRETRRGTRRLAPHLKRTVGIRPKLLADTGVYALGLPTEKDRPERVREQHAAFAELTEACEAVTGEPSVQAVAQFLRGLEESTPAFPDDFDPSATLTFRIDGVLPIDLPTVRLFWARQQAPEEDGAGTDMGGRVQCLICGETRPAVLRHPLKIKGIPGGQTSGTDLISANAAAFESYGLANSLIAPTCQPCAELYANGLNDLLGRAETSLRVGKTVYTFWTAKPSSFSPKKLLTQPESEDVRQLLRTPFTGQAAAIDIDPLAFYALGLSASGSRVVVRSWVDATVGEARQRLRQWFALQELTAVDGAEGAPLAVWRLANATVRDPRREPPTDRIVESLVGLALGGTPPPLEVLFAAVRRCRAEQGVTRERAALVKLVLAARPEFAGGQRVMERLDLTNNEPAYLCGRLLAVLDAIQRRALNNPNATIVDKFYGTASSAPASVFGTLLHGTRPHLAKLRKEPSTRGASNALEQTLEEVTVGLQRFPATLTLPEQGLFALGFYHQRAEDRRAMRQRQDAKDNPEPLPVAVDPEA